MSDQLSLFDAKPQIREKHYLFFALLPDNFAAQRARGLADNLLAELDPPGLIIRPKTLHVSLHEVGEFAAWPQDRIVAAARQAAGEVAAASFDLTLDSILSFKGPPDKRPMVMQTSRGTAELQDLWQRLGTALVAARLLRRAAGTVLPHMTLFRAGQGDLERPVEPIGWNVREFALIHNARSASDYETLESWTLRD